MTTHKEALTLALAEFEDQKLYFEDVGISFESIDNCITSLRQAIAEAESKRAALDAIIKSSEKRNEEWDSLSADEQATYHAENACPHCAGSGHKDDVKELKGQEPVARKVAECLAVLRPALAGKFPHEQALEELVSYTYPQPAQPKEPLTDEQITAAFNEAMALRPKEATNAETNRLFVRCIEAAHGIKGEA
jgi:hypothetical protein